MYGNQPIFARDLAPRAERRSSKAILEEIDEAEMEHDNLRMEAKGIFEEAKAANQDDLFPSRKRRFDELTDKPNGLCYQAKSKIQNLRNELAQAEERERNIILMSRNPSGIVYNQMSGGAPDRVLPTNGQLPGEGQRPYATVSRMAKLKAFHSDQAAYDAGQWYKAVVARAIHGTINDRAEEHCRSRGLEVTIVGTESSGTAGGYLVPAPVSSAIIEVRELVGVARKTANVMPMTADTLTVPKKTGGLTVYVVNEGQAITDSDKGWGSVAVATKKRACLSYLSQELSEDALINLVDNIVSEQGYALALQEDDELINGTGASTYGGIQGLLSSIGSAGVSTAATGHDTWPEIDIADMAAFVGKLPDRYFPYGPSIICSHSFFNQVLVRLAYTAGGVTASEVMAGTANQRSFWGYPVYLTSKMPTSATAATKCALFGSFSQAVILGDRGGIRVQRSDDIKFVEDLIALKAVARYDMNVHDKGDASNAGAYVALATAS